MALAKFISAMESIYGSFQHLTSEQATSWIPAKLAEGHNGRYLWTDGFAVVNFLTLYKETNDSKYLSMAEQLIKTVHSVLGFTRDGKSRLLPATDQNPLAGGLRIGKLDEGGEDGDGQYFHYLTVWMFALYQMTLASKNSLFVDQAITMAKAVHPKFMTERDTSRPRMYWKMSMDLQTPLVYSEGNLDPIDGYVIYSLLDSTKADSPFKTEVADYKKILVSKVTNYKSSDPLDLGMTLWTVHWQAQEEAWAKGLTDRARTCVEKISSRYFEYPIARRLAFRDFGAVLGIKTGAKQILELQSLADRILNQWESSKKSMEQSPTLRCINLVMYATALIPGAFEKGYWHNTPT